MAPARNKIHDLFLEHVMQQAPGYKKLIEMAGAPIMPTPAAVGLIMETIAKREHLNLIGVDIGGATTDVFSVFDGVFNRTVSANLGMSYSISNVLAEAGLANIMRWVPFTHRRADAAQSDQEQDDPADDDSADARRAADRACDCPRGAAAGLDPSQVAGDRSSRGCSRSARSRMCSSSRQSGKTLIDMLKLDLIVGSGGILSHAPRRDAVDADDGRCL